MSEEILYGAIFPPTHPYSWPVIGSMKDLSAASDVDVKNFFRLYYAPNNAILTIAGDFHASNAKTWVAKYFGGLPKGMPIQRPSPTQVTLDKETRLVYEDRVQIPRLYIAWPTAGESSDDRFALSVLDAITAGPRTARLTKALVYDQESASNVGTSQDSLEIAGVWNVVVTPRPGHSLTELESAVDVVLEKLKTEGPTVEEIQRATAGLEYEFIDNLQSNLGKSMTLSDGAGFHNNPGYFQTDYQKMMSVTPADVKRVANKYLTKGRVVLSIVPMGKFDQASKPSESKVYKGTEE